MDSYRTGSTGISVSGMSGPVPHSPDFGRYYRLLWMLVPMQQPHRIAAKNQCFLIRR